MPTNVRSLAVRREEGEWVASPARSSRRVAREISREVVAPRHRTFVMTPPEHLLDDAKAERVVIDDENPQSGRPLQANAILSLRQLDAFDAFLSAVYEACDDMEIPAQSTISEAGLGSSRSTSTTARRCALPMTPGSSRP